MQASYINSSSFSVEGNLVDEFVSNRRIKLLCGNDGVHYATIVSSYFNILTTVVIDEAVVTSNLTEVFYSVVKTGTQGNLPLHRHSTAEGDGGHIEYSFLSLTDTPDIYSEDMFLKSTVSGTQWATVVSNASFLSLSDTFDTYNSGNYLRTTASGINQIDGIILAAPNTTEWLLRVTNAGVLYTVQV